MVLSICYKILNFFDLFASQMKNLHPQIVLSFSSSPIELLGQLFYSINMCTTLISLNSDILDYSQ